MESANLLFLGLLLGSALSFMMLFPPTMIIRIKGVGDPVLRKKKFIWWMGPLICFLNIAVGIFWDRLKQVEISGASTTIGLGLVTVGIALGFWGGLFSIPRFLLPKENA